MLGALVDGPRCVGVVTDGGAIAARATLLATGGEAALWERTTNPPGAVGEGIALAYRAGAGVADLEFVQFHPTALAASGFLLSEALRGEGALLLDDSGERFTDELAPRDVVARAIAERGTALLDLRPIERGPLPAADGDARATRATTRRSSRSRSRRRRTTRWAAIVTDLDGRTELPGLYAAGECACTGVHGANRLASNSLLECLVFGRRAALAALGEPELPPRTRPAADRRAARAGHAGAPPSALAGRGPGPRRGRARAPPPARRTCSTQARSPRARSPATESRGGHFRADYPTEDPDARRPRRPPTRAGARARAMVRSPGARSRAHRARRARRGRRRRRRHDRGHGRRGRDLLPRRAAARGAGRRLRPRAAVERVFRALDPDVAFESSAADGDRVERRAAELARIDGPPRAVLTGERTALNLLGRLSGIATLTRRFVDAVEGTGATILDTRKTTPGLRALEKYAVRCGGGANHRFGLDDAILVKDNHLRARGRGPACRRAPSRRPAAGLPIEVEAETLDDVREALDAGAERILLDNMTAGAAARGRRSSSTAARRSRPPAASRSRPSARSPRPASTSSRSAR